jgi:DNA-binding transcriptional LysR family regulator
MERTDALDATVDLNRVRVFLRVVEAGSFTAAAAALGVRKSSVSRSVAALESELGIRLLQRTTRRIHLTDAGRAYHDRARDALAGLEEARQEVSALGAAPRLVVRVTAPVDLAGALADVTHAFVHAHPDVRVEMNLTARVVDLVREGFDLAVRAGVLADSSLLARRLGGSDLGLYAAPSYLEAAGRPRRLADLSRHACVLYRAGGTTATWRLTGPRGEEQVQVHGRVDSDEFAFVRAMLLAGAGIGLAPILMSDPLAASGALERVLPRLAVRGAALHVVWPSRRFEPAAVVRFRQALEEGLPRALGRGAGATAPPARRS